MFPIKNGLKEGDALTPMLFNFALEYAIRRVQVNQDDLKLNSTHQSLYYPTNAHNVKNVQLLKRIKIIEAAPTCFGLQRNHHQEATTRA